MTDNEIIKYMQCVIGKEMLCSECTYQKVLPFPSCRMMCAKNALDLINRLQDEKQALINGQGTLQNTIVEQKAEIEELRKGFTSDADFFASEYDSKIKAEAIKEFANRFAKALSEFDMSSVGLPDYDRGYKDCMTAIEDTIDNLVKEMTEIETNQRKEDEGK